jgi:ABC-type transporter Mla MlaB component
VQINAIQGTVLFKGKLDELLAQDELLKVYDEAQKQSNEDVVSIDMSGIDLANSKGVVAWLRFLGSNDRKIKYVNAPIWLVEQFNIITSYFAGQSYVESFQAPFYNSQTSKSESILLVVGKDVPLMKDYSKFDINTLKSHKPNYEPDFIPEVYFHFLANNYLRFKVIIGP